MLYIGIDWADDHHDVCLVDETGKRVGEFRISHSSEGLEDLLIRLRRVEADPVNWKIAIERPNGILVDFLLGQGVKVYPIPPQQAERFRERYTVSKKKDDRLDAFVLADVLRTDGHRLISLNPDSEIARELKSLVLDREHLIKSEAKLLNQIQACLKSYYPAPLQLFSSLKSETSRVFLKSYPDPFSFQRVDLLSWKEFLEKQHYPLNLHYKSAEVFYEEVKKLQVFCSVDAVVVKTKKRLMLTLLEQLEMLLRQIKEYDKAIEELMKHHPDSDIFTSLPGAGKVLEAKLSAHFGEDRSKFKSFESVQRLSGVAPITKRSGNYSLVQRRWICQNSFYQTITQFSFSTLKRCKWAKAYYDQKRKSGKSHATALRALANKWVKILFSLWKNKIPYREEKFLADRQNHLIMNAY